MSKHFTADELAGRIRPCICHHEYQDKKYGPGLRVHTVRPNKGQYGYAVCTVCGRETALLS